MKDKAIEAEKKKEVPPRALELFSESRSLLSQPFAFYSFGVSINGEQSREIMD